MGPEFGQQQPAALCPIGLRDRLRCTLRPLLPGPTGVHVSTRQPDVQAYYSMPATPAGYGSVHHPLTAYSSLGFIARATVELMPMQRPMCAAGLMPCS